MNSELKMNQLGMAGEKIVSNFFRSIGRIVEESLSTYDSIKDMTVNGETCEVKTQQLFHTENAFTMKKNQLTKCKNVDKLIFVEAPGPKSQSVYIWEAPKKYRKFRTRMTKDGRNMYLLGRENMILLTSITDKVLINEMKGFSNSTWKE